MEIRTCSSTLLGQVRLPCLSVAVPRLSRVAGRPGDRDVIVRIDAIKQGVEPGNQALFVHRYDGVGHK